jgi:flagellin-like hook-associated protein FlgL
VGAISERLSSGMRINRASDDAAGLAVASQLQADSRIKNQALRNINDFQSVTAIASGAVDALRTITERQRELATQAANGTYSGTQRAALQSEMTKLTEEYNRVIGSTSFNGISLLSNSSQEFRVQMGTGVENSLSFNLARPLMQNEVAPGSYFTVDGLSGTNYYVWFSVDGVGSDPEISGRTGIRVELGDSVDGTAESTNLNVEGSDAGSLYNTIFSFYAADGAGEESAYHVWFYDAMQVGGWTDPGGPGTAIQVTVSGLNDQGIASAIASAIGSSGAAVEVEYQGGTLLTITNQNIGNVTNASDIAGTLSTPARILRYWSDLGHATG